MERNIGVASHFAESTTIFCRVWTRVKNNIFMEDDAIFEDQAF